MLSLCSSGRCSTTADVILGCTSELPDSFFPWGELSIASICVFAYFTAKHLNEDESVIDDEKIRLTTRSLNLAGTAPLRHDVPPGMADLGSGSAARGWRQVCDSVIVARPARVATAASHCSGQPAIDVA